MLPYAHSLLIGVNCRRRWMFCVLTFRTYSFKNNVVPSKRKTVRILNGFLNACHVLHIYIKDTTAANAFDMIMVAANMVESIRAIWHLYLFNLTGFTQPLQIAVNGCSAYAGILPDNAFVYLIRSRMAF